MTQTHHDIPINIIIWLISLGKILQKN